MSILGRVGDWLKSRVGNRPKADIEIDLPPERKTLSKRLRAVLQQRANGRKTHQPMAALVKGTEQVFYFRSDWAKNEVARRRRRNKIAKASRRRNR